MSVLCTHNGVLKYVTCRPPLHAGNRIEDPGGQGSVGDRLGSVASTFLVGGSGFSGACVTQLSATAATAMLRGGSGRQRAVILQHQKEEEGKARRKRQRAVGGSWDLVCFIYCKNKNRFVALGLSGSAVWTPRRMKSQRPKMWPSILSALGSSISASLTNQLRHSEGSKMSIAISSCGLIKGSGSSVNVHTPNFGCFSRFQRGSKPTPPLSSIAPTGARFLHEIGSLDIKYSQKHQLLRSVGVHTRVLDKGS